MRPTAHEIVAPNVIHMLRPQPDTGTVTAEMADQWKKTALDMLHKSEPASRTEFVSQMLFACAEMLEYKLKSSKANAIGGDAGV